MNGTKHVNCAVLHQIIVGFHAIVDSSDLGVQKVFEVLCFFSECAGK